MRHSARNRSIRFGRSSPSRSPILVLVLVVVALVLLLLDRSGRLTPVRQQIETIISPALTSLQQISTQLSGAGRELGDVQQLRERTATLEQQVSDLQEARIQNETLKLRVEQLEKQLQIQQARPWKLLGVDVVAVTPDAGRHVLLIHAGREDGVERGMAVIGKEGSSPEALIGIVDEVGPRSSSVLLITDYNSQFSVKVYHEGTVADGVVRGQFQRGTWLRLEEVDRSVPLKAGDQVVTAGLTAQMGLSLPTALIPRNIPVGVVESARIDGYQQSAELRPYLAPNQVRYAWVILSHDD
jgi:rod shape-determining protein MreC